MSKSRHDLRGLLSRVDASVSLLHARYPQDREFFASTEGIFSDVLAQSSREDEDWMCGMIDWICTRHCIPYPAA
ncbi:MAG TPA: hypothetical protein VFG49_05760 [Dyella sp.]|uniref:hypothetical protein n=1 Tax=Dyella sp. TaxID=1869338 RepID=UPI002D799895|nr:hypothetical protein [Dyella sp.]HET6553029.1 hypothetical protein [Dyella sp.]